MAALLHRELTGEGQHIDVALASAAMSLTFAAASSYGRGETSPPRGFRGLGSLAYLRCQDGKWLVLANAETHLWENFCNALGRPDWTPLRGKRGAQVDQMLAEAQALFLTKPRNEWVEVLSRAGTSVAPVNDVGEAFADPQLQHVGMVWDMAHPKFGSVRQLGFPVRLQGRSVPAGTFAPLLGQHTREILLQAGYSAAEVEGFERDGTVKSWPGAFGPSAS